jgi:hypothetical protein
VSIFYVKKLKAKKAFHFIFFEVFKSKKIEIIQILEFVDQKIINAFIFGLLVDE